MSSLSALSPLLLRRGAASPWTCRTCTGLGLGSRSRSQAQRSFASRVGAVNSTVRPGEANKSRSSKSNSNGNGNGNGNGSRRRRGLVVAGGVVVVGAVAVATNDDARHAWTAAQRSYRVLGTLVLNIWDYRSTLARADDADYAAQLKACHQRCADRTLRTLEKNGSIFIKLGQHLSSMNYLLPNEWCDTFIPLQDKCPVSSYDSIRAMVLQDTGRSLDDFFSDFDPTPIGAASLAQVHRATVRETGQRVAVKVQHPALDEWARLDLALTSFTFSTLARWFPEYDLTWLSDEMAASLPQELDFALEGRNAMHARSYFSRVRDAPVVIPEVLWAKRRIIVMEYVAGARPDDLTYLDSHGIDRDQVSAALARVFNEMIFGRDAPLHCDPHGGNIAIRHNASPRAARNFDIVLYDHGLYRDIPLSLRRAYAHLWLAVLDGDEARMRRYAFETAGVSSEHFPLFASAITGRDYTVLAGANSRGVASARTSEEKKVIGDALGDGLLENLIQLLGKVPRVMLLILKTNDLTRSLDENLHTSQGPLRTFLILARYASRTVYDEAKDALAASSLFWPPALVAFLRAWLRHARVEVQLGGYEAYLWARARLGMGVVGVRGSFRE